MKTLYTTTYCENSVTIYDLDDSKRLHVSYSEDDPSSYGFWLDYGSDGVLDVITEYVRSLYPMEQECRCCQ